MHTIVPPLDLSEWLPQNDTLRGGLSSSSLAVLPPYSPGSPDTLFFSGYLNSSVFNAGFASQYLQPEKPYNLCSFSGLLISFAAGSSQDKLLTLVLKNELPPAPDADADADADRSPDRSTVSFEASFLVPEEGGNVWLPWDRFAPYYRGKEVEGKLDTGDVRRFAIMVRSFFGKAEQEGTFRFCITGIRAMTEAERERCEEDVGGGLGGRVVGIGDVEDILDETDEDVVVVGKGRKGGRRDVREPEGEAEGKGAMDEGKERGTEKLDNRTGDSKSLDSRGVGNMWETRCTVT